MKMSKHCVVVPRPLLSTLDLSGSVNMGHLLKALRARSKAGCRLGKNHLFVEDALKLGIQDYVDGLEFSDEDTKPRRMEFSAV